jgi:hypothetical chaperone protein
MSLGSHIYAIDFGTSNSLIAVADAQSIHPPIALDPIAEDPTIMRSLLYFDNQKGSWFGEEARKQFLENSMEGRFLKSFKRFLPVKNIDGTFIHGKQWTLEEIIGSFLKEMRERSNKKLNLDVESVVLGRPALFSEDIEADALAQARLTTAAKLAGFKNIEFLPEPVAAAYRYRLEMTKEELVLVADFGGGTSDFTLLKLSQKTFHPSDVLAIGGAAVAGDSLDGSVMRYRISKNFGSEVSYKVPMGSNVLHMPKVLVSYLCSTAYIHFLNSRENRDFLKRVQSWSLGPDDRKLMNQLESLLDNQLGFYVFEAIEELKRKMSTQTQATLEYVYPGIEIKEKITQKQFSEYTANDISKIFSALDETLKKAGIRPEQVSRVCCTGGTAKVALVRSELLKRFSEERLQNFRNFTSIVEGLAERGQQLLS